MAFYSSNDNGVEVMSEINMTPLVDVMLVLLIIFMVAMPTMQHSVNINLPQASARQQPAKTQDVQLVITADGVLTWNQQVVEWERLPQVADVAAQNQQLVLRVSADKETPYEKIAQVMAILQNAGLSQIALVTTPI